MGYFRGTACGVVTAQRRGNSRGVEMPAADWFGRNGNQPILNAGRELIRSVPHTSPALMNDVFLLLE
jgi:hypothetical protein